MPGSRLRRATGYAAVITVIVLAAVAVWVLARRDTGPKAAARSSPQAGPAPSSPLPSAPPGQVSMTGLTWTNYDGVQLPSSPLAGPRQHDGGLASGFADTATGAVLAAVNIAVRATPQFGPAVYIPTISRQVTGPDAAALLRSCAAAYQQAAAAAHLRDGQPLGAAYVTEQGFRAVAWSPSQAVIDIASAGPGPQGITARAATRVELEWLAGDWRLVAPPGGDWAAAAVTLPSLAGFTVFPLPAAPGPLYIPPVPHHRGPARHATARRRHPRRKAARR